MMDLNKWFGGSFSKLHTLLHENSKKIVILTHRNPDGDAIGSSLALYNLLIKLGHKADIIVPNSFPDFLKWMKSADNILVFPKSKERCIQLIKNAELVFSLDFNDLSRIKEFDEHLSGSGAYKILIDHHPNPQNFAELCISDVEFSSTAELLYRFFIAMKFEKYIDIDIVSCIYAGIMTDTGCFSFNSSHQETFHAVAELLKFGINKDQIYSKVYDNYSFDRMRLMGYCLDKKMQYLPEYRTAFINLSQDELKLYNFKIGDSESFVNLPLSIEGVIFSALFTENSHLIRISLRSKGDFPVNSFCADHFNGGGHKNAAGGESSESLQKTIDKFVNLLPKYKNELLKD